MHNAGPVEVVDRHRDPEPISPATTLCWHPMPSTEASWCPRPTGGPNWRQRRSASARLVLNRHHQPRQTAPSRRFPGLNASSGSSKSTLDCIQSAAVSYASLPPSTQPDVIQKILDHVHQQQAPPRQPPRRVTGPITSEIQFDAL